METYGDYWGLMGPHPENLKFPPRRFFSFSVARSLRSQISPILSTLISMATNRAVDDHEQLIPNRHCAIFLMPKKLHQHVAQTKSNQRLLAAGNKL